MRKLVADCWGCGDDCNCWYTRIREYCDEDIMPYGDNLYEGMWMNDYPQYSKDQSERDEFEQVREEFKKACVEYGIEIDLSSDCQWDWEAERVIL